MISTAARTRETARLPFGIVSLSCGCAGLLVALAFALPSAAHASSRVSAAAHSPAAAADRLALRVESELRYPEGGSELDARSLACFASARDLDRLRSVEGLEDDLRGAFFRRGLRLLLVDDAVREGIEGRPERPALADLAFLGDARAGEIRIQGDSPVFAAVTVAYESKPWVDDLDAVRGESARRGAVAVRGDSGLEGSAEDALASALSSAAVAVRDEAIRVASESSKSGRRRGLRTGERDSLADRLAVVLPASIIERNFLSDRYLEEIEKPYGNVYRASVLVRADTSALVRAVAVANDDVDREQESRLVKAGVLALAAPILLGLYLWLDSATRGYFSGLLKVAFVLGFGGISWAVLQMSL